MQEDHFVFCFFIIGFYFFKALFKEPDRRAWGPTSMHKLETEKEEEIISRDHQPK